MPQVRLRLFAVAIVLCAVAVPGSSGAFGLSHNAGGRLIAAGLTAPQAVSDGSGGIILAARDPGSATARVNRYSATAGARWAQGLSFGRADGVQLSSDGAGGAIVGVEDSTTNTLTSYRILPSGSTVWQVAFPAGVLAAGGDGGAWVVSQSQELYADGVTPDGFPRPRVQITNGPEAESLPTAIGDGNGGLYLAWRQAIDQTQFSIGLQHLAADGTIWSSPADVAGSSEPNLTPSLSPDGAGGVLVSWTAAGHLWVADYDAAGHPAWDHTLTLRNTIQAQVLGAPSGVFIVWVEQVRAAPLENDIIFVSFAGRDGQVHWNRDVATVGGGVLDLKTAVAGDSVAVGWQTAAIPILGAAIDTDLHVASVTSAGALGIPQSKEMLASSLGPDSFGALVDGGNGYIDAVFTQAPCLRPDVSGVAMQRIAPDGSRAFGADGACP